MKKNNLTDKQILKSLQGKKEDIEKSVKDLYQQIAALNQEKEKVLSAIEAYGGSFKPNGESVPEDDTVYPRNKTFRDKILFVIRSQGKALASNQIFDAIIAHEPEREKKRTLHSISANLTTLSKNGSIIMKFKKLSGRGHLYGDPDWSDEKGNLRKKYQPVE
ncbi:MAG: hypothetical protein COC01_02755 [Bacteroidetes bacterium]|nr:MAG: hypothetical protein COC01_02755 [Bacteroidota bacterium]